MVHLRKANPVAAALAVGELDAEYVAAAVPADGDQHGPGADDAVLAHLLVAGVEDQVRIGSSSSRSAKAVSQVSLVAEEAILLTGWKQCLSLVWFDDSPTQVRERRNVDEDEEPLPKELDGTLPWPPKRLFADHDGSHGPGPTGTAYSKGNVRAERIDARIRPGQVWCGGGSAERKARPTGVLAHVAKACGNWEHTLHTEHCGQSLSR